MSQHFARSEFACPHCGVALVRPQLLARLEVLRAMKGKPLIIVSGYRCPPHNAAVAGAPDSQHMYGAAADLELGAATVEQARRAGFTGIGRNGNFAVHVDVRDGGFKTWVY